MVNTTLRPQILPNGTNFTWQTDIFFNKDTTIYKNLSVIGNGLVIFVTGYRMKIVSFIDREFIINNILYKCGYLIYVLNMFASAFFLTVISLDRSLCTWLVVWAQNKRTLVKARIVCVFVWILSICCSIPVAIVYCKPINYEQYFKESKSLTIYMFMVGFLIPFLIITSSYIAIGVRVKRLTGRNQLRLFRVISVILAFFICWFPFHFVQLFATCAPFSAWKYRVLDILYRAFDFLFSLVFLNSCLNPILYVFMCDEYKTKLKKSLLLVLEGAFKEDHLGLR